MTARAMTDELLKVARGGDRGHRRGRYGLYAENRPLIGPDPARVPEPLRDRVPLAEAGGIGDDIIRFDVMEQSSPAERQELLRAVSPRFAQVEAWLATARRRRDERRDDRVPL